MNEYLLLNRAFLSKIFLLFLDEQYLDGLYNKWASKNSHSQFFIQHVYHESINHGITLKHFLNLFDRTCWG